MVLQKKITKNNLLIWVVSFLTLTPQVSFSEEGLDGKSEANANSQESVSDENQPTTKLDTIKIHYKNKTTGAKKSSESLVYASFEKDKYVVVCQSLSEQYQEAQEKCDDLKKEANLGVLLKAVDFSRNTINFSASEYKDQNKHYPVNLDALKPEPSSGEFAELVPEEQTIGNIQNHKNEHHTKVAEKDLEAGISKSQSFPPKKVDTSEYDYDIGDFTSSKDVLSEEVNSGYSNFEIGMGSLGIAGLFAAGTGFAAYKNKWRLHAENGKLQSQRLQDNSAIDLNKKVYIPVSLTISQQESLFLGENNTQFKNADGGERPDSNYCTWAVLVAASRNQHVETHINSAYQNNKLREWQRSVIDEAHKKSGVNTNYEELRDRANRRDYDNLDNLGNEFYEEKIRIAFPNLDLPKSDLEMKKYLHGFNFVIENYSSQEEFLSHIFNGKKDVFIKVGGSSQLVMQTEDPKKIYLFDSHRSENKVFDEARFLLHLNATYIGAEIMYY